MKEKLWIVSELFYPEESATAFILTNIAIKLKEKYDITVITGNPIYETVGKTENEELSDIKIIRISGSKINKNNILKRLIRAIFLPKKFSNALKKNAKENDKVLAVTNPAFNIINISELCKRKKLKLTILAHDIFPENTISAGIMKRNSKLYKFLLHKFNKAYNSASSIITCGEDMTSVIERKLDKKNNISVFTISNWANIDDLQYIPLKESDKIEVKFAGNIGRVQGIEDVLNIIKKVENPCVNFVFQGSGACVDVVKKCKFKNISYCPPYKRSEEQNVISGCTIGLVTLANDMFGLGVPSKTYNLLACGRPILFLGPKNSEIYNLVKKYDIGWAFDLNQIDEIISFINNLTPNAFTEIKEKSIKSRKVAEDYFSKDSILTEFLEKI